MRSIEYLVSNPIPFLYVARIQSRHKRIVPKIGVLHHLKRKMGLN